MTRIKLVLFILTALTSAEAAEFCSLVVRVTAPGGNGVSGVPATVKEANGRMESALVENGEVRFCDLGVLPVTVTVGAPSSCDYTVVQNVILTWELTRTLRVVYDLAPCRVDGPPPILLCSVLLRFAEEEGGMWVPDVAFTPALPRARDVQSDTYGRVIVRLANHEHIQVSANRPGYAPQLVEINCSSGLTERERIIHLRKVR